MVQGVINAQDEDPVTVVQEKTGGAHGILVTAVHPSAFGQAIGMARRGGTIVFNGLPQGFPRHRSSTSSSRA